MIQVGGDSLLERNIFPAVWWQTADKIAAVSNGSSKLRNQGRHLCYCLRLNCWSLYSFELSQNVQDF